MAYEGPFSNRLPDNLVRIFESDKNFSADKSTKEEEPIILDATVSFTKNYSASISNNPVGDKSDRANHYHLEPLTINVSGVVSNDSVDIYSWAKSIGGTARSQLIVERLEKIVKEKILINIFMPDSSKTENCLITSLSINRDAQWSNGFRIEIAAQQIKLITDEITGTPIPEKEDAVSEESNGGSSTGKSQTPTTGDKGQPQIIYQKEGVTLTEFVKDTATSLAKSYLPSL